ncbi:wax ester/triacylglycerol synthase domain-containing protein [Streptomyces violascens]|uniref:wax ester/triacylglycerol synthase domain-containing protein n=1 Tax=Streptomyces violascens TaxID=67381 RepID=UPI00367AA45C
MDPFRLGALDSAFLALGQHHDAGAAETGILVLMTGTPPPLAELTEHIRHRAEHIPALHLRPDRTGPALTRPRWRYDSTLDITRHVHEYPRRHKTQTIADLAAHVMSRPRDTLNTPLWSLELLHGTPHPGEPDFALLFKHHHAAFDGRGAIAILRQLLGPDTRAPQPDPPVTMRHSPLKSGVQALRGAASLGTDLTHRAPHVPALRSSTAWPCHITWVHTPLDDLRDAARTSHTTVNDVYLATLALTLAGHLDALGQPRPPAIVATVPMAMPRSDDHLGIGNSIAPARIPLPTGTDHPREKLRQVHKAVRQAKTPHRQHGSKLVLRACQILPPQWTHRLLTAPMRSRFTNLVASNLGTTQGLLACPGGTALALMPLVLRPLGGGLSSGIATYETTATVSFITSHHSDPHRLLPARYQQALRALLS